MQACDPPVIGKQLAYASNKYRREIAADIKPIRTTSRPAEWAVFEEFDTFEEKWGTHEPAIGLPWRVARGTAGRSSTATSGWIRCSATSAIESLDARGHVPAERAR